MKLEEAESIDDGIFANLHEATKLSKAKKEGIG